jgi:hypothetical protein
VLCCILVDVCIKLLEGGINLLDRHTNIIVLIGPNGSVLSQVSQEQHLFFSALDNVLSGAIKNMGAIMRT